jgi:tripartite-type tricarboxylate transporter receptor subunit TctC
VHGWYGLLLKSGTPQPIVDQLYKEVKKALETKEVRDIFQAQGIEPGGMPPAQYTALVRDDLALWQRTVKQLNITLE